MKPFAILLVLCLLCGCATAPEPAQSNLEFIGTFTKMDWDELPDAINIPWTLHFRVDEVLSGSFASKSIGVRTSTRMDPRWDRSNQYRIRAEQTAHGYVLRESTWVKRSDDT
jgi:hypothetical protein